MPTSDTRHNATNLHWIQTQLKKQKYAVSVILPFFKSFSTITKLEDDDNEAAYLFKMKHYREHGSFSKPMNPSCMQPSFRIVNSRNSVIISIKASNLHWI
jgi:hypothetical protein